jgi:UDP:flavonoid glycosyltransferase YjiC (YdhE family)
VATNAHYREKIEGLGLEFRLLRPETADPAEDPSMMRRVMHLKTGPRVLMTELLIPSMRDSYEDLDAIASEGIDLIVAHPLAWAAHLVAEKRGIPWASLALSPMSYFSAHDFPVLAPLPFLAHLRGLGPRFHRPLTRVLMQSIRPWVGGYHQLRHDLGLPPGPDPFHEGQHSPTLSLAMFSQSFGAPQPDWPPSAAVTGFAYFDQGMQPGFPPELEAFLDGGPPPIVFTLGTAAVFNAGNFYRESITAAQRLGRRAVLLIGRDPSNQIAEPLPEGIIAAQYAPYSQIFPRAAAIVHQGGVGTTAQALRSGRPMIVMPHAFDQPDNADRVTRMGVGLTIPKAKYNADRATRALGRLLNEPSFASRAAAVGAKIREEDGTPVSCDLLIRKFGLIPRGEAAQKNGASGHSG